jgi:hypothetical protein
VQVGKLGGLLIATVDFHPRALPFCHAELRATIPRSECYPKHLNTLDGHIRTCRPDDYHLKPGSATKGSGTWLPRCFADGGQHPRTPLPAQVPFFADSHSKLDEFRGQAKLDTGNPPFTRINSAVRATMSA